MTKKTTEAEVMHLVAITDRISEAVQGEKLLDVMSATAMITAYAIIDQFDSREARVKAANATRDHIVQMIEQAP